MSHSCTLHPNQNLVSYCDSCRDAVCLICTKMGPHADIRHQIMSIEEAAKLRQTFYLAYREKQIHPTIERVCLHLSSLAQKKLQLIRERKVIEKDIAIEFEGIATRIQNSVSKRVVKKQTEIKNYQEVLNKMEDLVYSFDGVLQFPQRFLLCYRQFHQQLKHLETMTLSIHTPPEQTLSLKTVDMKAISTSWKIQPLQPETLEIPRQMALSFAKANQLPLFKEKNKFLNSLVGMSVQNYHREIFKAKKEVIQTQKKILNQYNNQNQELLRMHKAKVCAFCLTAFSLDEANEPCSHNKSFKAEPSYKELEIPPQVRGCKMHYWVPARASERPIPDLKTHSLVRILHKKQFLNSLKDLREVVCQLKKYDINQGKDGAYLNQFKKDDPQSKGIVTPLAFLFIMTNKFQVEETQVKVLTELCKTKGEAGVQYTKMAEVLRDPVSLHRAFEVEEEEAERSKPTAPPSFKFRY